MPLPEKRVKELIALMNSKSNANIPAVKPVIEMFDMAMDEKTMEYLLFAGQEVHSEAELEQIYYSMYGNNRQDWQKFWQNIKLYSFLHPCDENNHDLYELSPIFPGWVEFYTAGEQDENKKAVKAKFMEFWGLLKKLNIAPVRRYMNRRGEKKIREGRVPRVTSYINTGREITLNKPLENKQHTFIQGDVYSLLEKYRDEIRVVNCFCRLQKMVEGGECDLGLPLESCVVIGALTGQLEENGVARHISYEEAVKLIDELSDKGCIHTAFHHGNFADMDEMVICNCCPDCCLLYEGYNNGGLSNIFTRAYYVPQLQDITKCVGCDICGRFCPTDATYYDKQKKELVFRYENCIGCGQCVKQCKFDVRTMVKDQRDVFVKTKKRVK